MSNNLPPLPDWLQLTNDEVRSRVRAYGQQCRQQALEDAAKVCDERDNRFHPASAFSAELHNCAAAIRALKEKT